MVQEMAITSPIPAVEVLRKKKSRSMLVAILQAGSELPLAIWPPTLHTASWFFPLTD